MNKETLVKLITMLLFSYIGLALFSINEYLIIFVLICYFGYDFLQGKQQIERRNRIENKELLNEIKSTTNDAYLKHKQLLTMISNIPFPLLLLDVSGKVVLYNTSFNRFRESKEDRNLDYIDNDCKFEIAEFLKDAYIFEKQIDKTITVDEKIYQAISVPVTIKGKFSGCVILFQDITLAKERESMQKQFIADASHELKTPISVIKGMIEILNRDDFDDEKTRIEFLHQIEKETSRLEIIVRDLLQLSRLSKDNLILKRETIDFTQIIDDSLNSFTRLAKEKNIAFDISYQSHESVFVDKELSITLMNNLISNAIKYSDSGTIHIKTEEINDEYIVSIEDEGVGLSKEDCVNIFERFYRVDKARSRDSGGSGLGLPIVKSIIEAHGGKISVDSELGKGTKFTIHFKY
ncbi:MAG: sensor histidine kinase [Erysipelotrichia bacterium]|nr:sensor histidine kinase [Erysipelotrichia bacterium]